VLETLGVPVLGYRTDRLPLFYSAEGGPPVSARVDSPEQAARLARAHWELGGAGLLLGNAPENGIDVEPLLEQALQTAAAEKITGQAVTPFVLSFLHERSGGRTLEVNRELVVANAALAAQVAVAFRSPS
jgi:pseudouridine-5'-phosphate glycosidase